MFADNGHVRPMFRLPLRNGEVLELGRRTLIVGVLNVTPDSFSDGGRHYERERAIERALEMQSEGADIIEIGGESTRPGAVPVAVETEMSRILPVLSELVPCLRIPISIDTYKSEVARRALENGASIINDVTALQCDPAVADEAAEWQAPLVLMYMWAMPGVAESIAPKPNILAATETHLAWAISEARRRGVSQNRLVVDIGIGFGKPFQQDLALIRNLHGFHRLGVPIMLGTSRKNFIGRVTGKPTSERIFSTAASVALGIFKGAHIVRVHDVREMADVVRVTDAVLGDIT